LPNQFKDVVAGIVEQNSFMTIATADGEGRPWATPVWYAHSSFVEFLWVSRPDTRHSQNIAVRPQVAIVVFDSTVKPADAQGVYIEATAAEVAAEDLSAKAAIYSQRSQARGLRAWSVDDVSGSAPLRLYAARVMRLFILDDAERRIPMRV
jgi:uncharacterized protein YhbP (UPF0306 family)